MEAFVHTEVVFMVLSTTDMEAFVHLDDIIQGIKDNSDEDICTPKGGIDLATVGKSSAL